MKKIIIPVLLSFIVSFFTSCSKQKAEVNNDQVVNEVLALKSAESKKIAFSELLSPVQKNVLWQKRLNDLLTKPEFTNAQKELILEIKNTLSEKMFRNDEGRDQFMKEFGYIWQHKALTIFGYENCYKYFGSLSDINESSDNYERSSTEDEEEEIDEGALKTCNCNKTSSVSCLTRDECTNPHCEETSSGCGWWWAYACNGRCKL